MSEKIADFTLKHAGTSYSQNSDGNLVATINWETDDDMEIYGAVYGTLTVIHNYGDPDADSGEVSWAGEGYSPDETKTIGFQSGTWAKAGINTWSLKMTGKDSREGGVSTESQISLETLTWSGTVYRA